MVRRSWRQQDCLRGRQDRLGGRRDRLGGRRDRLRGRQDEVGNMHAARRKVWNNQRKVNKLCSQVENNLLTFRQRFYTFVVACRYLPQLRTADFSLAVRAGHTFQTLPDLAV